MIDSHHQEGDTDTMRKRNLTDIEEQKANVTMSALYAKISKLQRDLDIATEENEYLMQKLEDNKSQMKGIEDELHYWWYGVYVLLTLFLLHMVLCSHCRSVLVVGF